VVKVSKGGTIWEVHDVQTLPAKDKKALKVQSLGAFSVVYLRLTFQVSGIV
jgi:hypothetical protein